MSNETIELLEMGLYEKRNFQSLRFYLLDGLYGSSFSYDCYCQLCGTDSVFLKEAEVRGLNSVSEVPFREHVLKNVTLRCSRDKKHKIFFQFTLYQKDDNNIELTKVGQFPSVADVVNTDTQKYQKVLGKNDNHEFNKAIGLNAHGVGIGSFVYLRRIFENLIEKAHQTALTSSDWNDEGFLKERMNVKIEKLKEYLPEFLVENRIIYSILSKGIHELTEEECKNAFPAVKAAIEIILDEKLLKQEIERKRKEAAQSIAKIHADLKKATH